MVMSPAIPFKPAAAEPEFDGLQIFAALIFVIGIFALGAWALKRRLAGNPKAPGLRPTVLSRTHISPGLVLIVIEYGRERLLLAHARDSVQVLRAEPIDSEPHSPPQEKQS